MEEGQGKRVKDNSPVLWELKRINSGAESWDSSEWVPQT